MRVLLAHNYYGSEAPSGENRVFEAERDLLAARGHEVETLVRASDTIRRAGLAGAIRGALSTPWNPWAAAAARRAVASFAPDVFHAHNTFPLLSPAIFHAVGGRAARVLTLHNYRLFCPAATPMRAGRICTECLDRRSPLPSVVHGCYRDSRLATLPLAIGVALHRRLGTWLREIDAFVALTDFQRDRMVAAGLPADRVHVKPNFYQGAPRHKEWAARGAYAVVAGRLAREKGVDTAIRAWARWGPGAPPLLIAGDGPDRPALERLAAGIEAPVRFVGQLSPEDAARCIADARLLVLPSRWFEGFPMVLVEAFAFGTPAAASNIGSLASIVRAGQNGVLFEVDDPDGLLAAVRDAWETPGLLERLGKGARRAFETQYTENSSFTALMEIYQAARAVSRSRRP